MPYTPKAWKDETRTQKIKLGTLDSGGYQEVQDVTFEGEGQIGDIVNAVALNELEAAVAEAVEDCKASINEIYYVCADGVTTAPNTFYYSTGNVSTWIFPKAIAPPSVTTLPNDFLRYSKVAEFEGVNVTTAGNRLMLGCTALTSVSLPALTTTTGYLLEGCTSLTSVSLPALTTAGNRLMLGCTSLTSVSLPALTTAETQLLYNCTSLTSVSLPALTTAETQLLYNCTSLTSVSLPALTTAVDRLLEGCTALTSVSLPALTTAGQYLLYNCTSLTSVSLPALTTAGQLLLHNCTSLTSVSLPALTTAGQYLLYNCTSLTSVSLPALTTAGQLLLNNCTSLTSLTVGGANTLTLTSTGNNDYRAWKLPVSDMVAFGTALKTATSATTITFAAAYYNALNSTQKAIFTNKNYTITTV